MTRQTAQVRPIRFRLGIRFSDDFNIDDRVGVSFPKVTYAQVAPLVGLDPDLELQDISTFEIHRSRIPTDLFKSIVVDMDVMMVQYGPPHVHKTEEARSRFFSPVKDVILS